MIIPSPDGSKGTLTEDVFEPVFCDELSVFVSGTTNRAVSLTISDVLSTNVKFCFVGASVAIFGLMYSSFFGCCINSSIYNFVVYCPQFLLQKKS